MAELVSCATKFSGAKGDIFPCSADHEKGCDDPTTDYDDHIIQSYTETNSCSSEHDVL